jgi:hypothetical protein
LVAIEGCGGRLSSVGEIGAVFSIGFGESLSTQEQLGGSPILTAFVLWKADDDDGIIRSSSVFRPTTADN